MSLLARDHVGYSARVVRRLSTLPRVGLVHRSDFARNRRPLHFATERSATALALEFFPFEEFVAVEVSESAMNFASMVRRLG